MFQFLSSNSSGENLKAVVDQLVAAISQPEMKLVMFFTSKKYDIRQVGQLFRERFPSVAVVGCTTAGEISDLGFTEGSISAFSIAADDFEVAPYLIKDIKQRAILAKNDLLATAEKIGITPNSEDGFVITLIDSGQSAEEKVLSILSNTFPKLNLVGGSAASEDFKEQLVSVNGETEANAAVVIFIRTSREFLIYKENIYVPTNIELDVTKVDIQKRLVLEFNGKPATEEYARNLGISLDYLKANFQDVFFENPVGRTFGDDVWITDPISIVDETGIGFAALIMSHTTVKLLKPVNALTEAAKTIETVKQKLPNCKGVILFNCFFRYLQFKKDNQRELIAAEYKKLGSICGFNTHGEQLNRHHMNQTLTLVAFGE